MAIVINYSILYAKYNIYLEKLKDNNQNDFNVDILWYVCHLKQTLKIEQNIGYKKNYIICCMPEY